MASSVKSLAWCAALAAAPGLHAPAFGHAQQARVEEPAAIDRVRAQAWLKLRGYGPAVLHLSTLKRLGARVTSANIAFDDHPDGQRHRGRIATVTADSVFLWLARSGLASRPTAIR